MSETFSDFLILLGVGGASACLWVLKCSTKQLAEYSSQFLFTCVHLEHHSFVVLGCHYSFLLETFVSYLKSCRLSLLCTVPDCWTGTWRTLLTPAQNIFLKDLDTDSVQQGRQLSWQPQDIQAERHKLCCHLSKMCLYCWSSFKIHQINCSALAVNEQWWWNALWVGEARFGGTLPVIEGESWCCVGLYRPLLCSVRGFRFPSPPTSSCLLQNKNCFNLVCVTVRICGIALMIPRL